MKKRIFQHVWSNVFGKNFAIFNNCLLKHFVFREDVESLETISPTDIKCVWSIQKVITNDKYKPLPINEMPKKNKESAVTVDK